MIKFIIGLVILISSCCLYWVFVVRLSTSVGEEGNEYGMKSIEYKLNSILHNSTEDENKSDFCIHIAHYLWNKSDEIEKTYLPKFLIP